MDTILRQNDPKLSRLPLGVTERELNFYIEILEVKIRYLRDLVDSQREELDEDETESSGVSKRKKESSGVSKRNRGSKNKSQRKRKEKKERNKFRLTRSVQLGLENIEVRFYNDSLELECKYLSRYELLSNETAANVTTDHDWR